MIYQLEPPAPDRQESTNAVEESRRFAIQEWNRRALAYARTEEIGKAFAAWTMMQLADKLGPKSAEFSRALRLGTAYHPEWILRPAQTRISRFIGSTALSVSIIQRAIVVRRYGIMRQVVKLAEGLGIKFVAGPVAPELLRALNDLREMIERYYENLEQNERYERDRAYREWLAEQLAKQRAEDRGSGWRSMVRPTRRIPDMGQMLREQEKRRREWDSRRKQRDDAWKRSQEEAKRRQEVMRAGAGGGLRNRSPGLRSGAGAGGPSSILRRADAFDRNRIDLLRRGLTHPIIGTHGTDPAFRSHPFQVGAHFGQPARVNLKAWCKVSGGTVGPGLSGAVHTYRCR